jgi:HEAT repeat protein
MKMRKVILQVLIEIGHDTPEIFLPYLSDPRWYVVRNMAFILARIASPGALDKVVTLISHREPRIRKEVLNYLERTPDPKAKNYLLKFLRDDSSAFRIRALQVLGNSNCMFALKPIAAMTASELFQEKDIEERKAAYEALGALGADQVLPMFREMIMKKFWFNKAKEQESVICAVAGLMKIKSEGALGLLEEANAVKGDEMREIINQAIVARSAENSKKSAGP